MSDGHLCFPCDTYKAEQQNEIKYGDVTFSDIHYHHISSTLRLGNKTKSHLVMNMLCPSDILFFEPYRKDKVGSSIKIKITL